MKSLIQMTVIAALAATLAACGGGAKLKPGKENAAAALFMASQGLGQTGSPIDLAGQGAAPSLDVTVSCPRGGKLTFHLVVDGTSTSGGVQFELRYDGCNTNGRTSMTGALTTTFTTVVNGSSVSTALQLKGRVNFSGDISDFIDVNITETMDVTELSASQGVSVSLVLNGSIQTSSATYTYTNETINITAGGVEPDPSNS